MSGHKGYFPPVGQSVGTFGGLGRRSETFGAIWTHRAKVTNRAVPLVFRGPSGRDDAASHYCELTQGDGAAPLYAPQNSAGACRLRAPDQRKIEIEPVQDLGSVYLCPVHHQHLDPKTVPNAPLRRNLPPVPQPKSLPSLRAMTSCWRWARR